jgi:IclR family transcriptional regulator, KDG regulon repressor
MTQQQSSIERALDVLRYLARHPGEHGVRELGTALSLSPSTTFRLLDTLARLGFARQNQASGKYAIGVQAIQLGIAALSSFSLTTVAPSYLQSLARETGESVFLAVLDDGAMVYLLKHEGWHTVRTTATLGSRRPAYCTGLGKAVLATMPLAEAEAVLAHQPMQQLTPATITSMPELWRDLAEARLRGYAIDREENEVGLMCVAAPVHDYTGQVLGAISLSCPKERMQLHASHYGRRVAATALEISLALGYLPRGNSPALGLLRGVEDSERSL